MDVSLLFYDKTDYFDKMDALCNRDKKLTKNLNAT